MYRIVLSVLGLLAVIYLANGLFDQRSLRRATALELKLLLQRWVESGSPSGGEVVKFLHGRNPDLVASNIVITINGTNFHTVFALKRPKSREKATCFITARGTCIWVPDDGKPKLMN